MPSRAFEPASGRANARRKAAARRDWLRIGVAASALGFIVGVALLTRFAPGFSWETNTLDPSEPARARWSPVASPSSVSAPPDAVREQHAPPPATRDPAATDAPIRVRSASLSRLSGATRIRIATDRRASYSIEGAGQSTTIRILLEDSMLGAPISNLDLAAHGLRALRIVDEEDTLVMEIEVARPTPVQSQWIAATNGAALFIDLELPLDETHARTSRSALPATVSAAPRRDSSSRSGVPLNAAPDRFDTEAAREPAAPPPAAMAIARSRSDSDRNREIDALAEAERVLNQARLARAAGDLTEAAQLFEHGLATNPGHRALTLERTRLLVEMERPEDALALIREARREAPRDVSFALLHARLLDRMGDRTSAIAVLESASFELADAPEIFALRAAYLQKSEDHTAAIEQYEALVRRFPERSRWWMGMGISLEAKDRRREALDVYRIAIELDGLPEASRGLGREPRSSALEEELVVARKKIRIGDLLVENRVISEAQLTSALAEQKKTGLKLGRQLIEAGYLDEDRFLEFLSQQLDIPCIDVARYEFRPKTVELLPETYARRFRAIVLDTKDGVATVGMADPTNIFAMDEIERILKMSLVPAVVRESELLAAIDRNYRKTSEIHSLAEELHDELDSSDFDLSQLEAETPESDAAVVRLLKSIFEDAVQIGTSDIHIEPDESCLRIRQRVDGVLHEQLMKETRIASALVLRLKLMSGLNISERRLPQDGRFNIRVKNRSIDVRVSTLPVQWGESVVMRLLDQTESALDLDSVGMPERILARFRHHIHQPHGLILVTGPTGSGKTTTLYGALSELNEASKKDHLGRRPRRIPAASDSTVADQHEDRARLRERPAFRTPAGSGHRHDRRDARPGDGGDCPACGDDRAPRILDAAYE